MAVFSREQKLIFYVNDSHTWPLVDNDLYIEVKLKFL